MDYWDWPLRQRFALMGVMLLVAFVASAVMGWLAGDWRFWPIMVLPLFLLQASAFLLFIGLKTQIASLRFQRIHRSKMPVSYWLVILFYVVCFAVLLLFNGGLTYLILFR